MKTLLYILLLVSPLAAAAAEFPLGFYGVASPAELPVLKRAGFNAFHSYVGDPARLAALAKEARRQRMKMVIYPDRVIGSPFEKEARRWPVLGWYLFDEPEVKRIPYAQLQALEKRVKDWDPRQPTVFVVGEGIAAFTYGGAGDALMVDWYPVPHLKPESVGEQVALAKAGAAIQDTARKDKPVWAVLQAFDWINYPQRRANKVGGFPTFDQVRYMTWLAVARGAQGVFYFTYNGSDGVPLPSRPERWSTYERMASELNALRPALEKGRAAPLPEGLPEGLVARAIKKGWRTYLVLLNPGLPPMKLPEALKGWRPLFEARREVPDTLGTHRVLVLEK